MPPNGPFRLTGRSSATYLRAATVPSSYDAENLTVELVASTGQRVLRAPWIGESFFEELGLRAGEVDLARLQNGAPLLDSHRRRSLRDGDVIGVVEKAILVENRELRVVVRLSGRDDLADLRADVAAGIIRECSIGYTVRKFQDVTPDGTRRKILRAVDWQPFEVSLLAVGADSGSGVRSTAEQDPALAERAAELGSDCTFITSDPSAFRGLEMLPTLLQLQSLARHFGLQPDWAQRQFDAGLQWERAIELARSEGSDPGPDASIPEGPSEANQRSQPDEGGEDRADSESEGGRSAGQRGLPASSSAEPAAPPAGQRSAAPPSAPPAPEPDRTEAARAERVRIRGIGDLAARYGLAESWATRQIDSEVSIETARIRALDQVAERDAQSRGVSSIAVLRDENDGHLARMERSLLIRCNYTEPDDHGTERALQYDDSTRAYRGLDLIGLCRAYLEVRGERAAGLTPMEVATRSLHGTSDFPEVFANVASKFAMQAYEQAPQTFKALGTRRDMRDFKQGKVVQLGEAPALQLLGAQGEVRRGTVGEFAEPAMLSTYASMLGFSRQAIVNDDLSLLSRVPRAYGASALATESDLAYALLTGNVVLSDTYALFDNTNHANDVTGTLSADSGQGLANGRTAMRLQTGVGDRVLNLTPRFLVVPAAQETAAQKATAATIPNAPTGVNPFASQFQSVMVESRLDADSSTKFYMAADPAQVDVLMYGYLEGYGPGPRIETRNGFDVDGMEIRCLHDFYVIVPDHRGWVRVSGA